MSLRRHDIKVIEVARPPRRGERRAVGKSDTIDAEHAAREMLSGWVTTVPNRPRYADNIIPTAA